MQVQALLKTRKRLTGAMMICAALTGTPSVAIAQASPTASWIERLQSGDLRQRLSARYDFDALAADRTHSIPDLVAALHHDDPAVREHAAAALGELAAGSDDPVAPLLAALSDPDPAVASQAALALAKIGEPAADAMMTHFLSAEGLAEPTRAAILKEDYAFASLRLMQERSASAIADALIRLSALIPPPAPEPENVARSALRPGFVGNELKLEMVKRLAFANNPAGGRIIARRLLGAAATAEPGMGEKLRETAIAILYATTDQGYVDPEPERAQSLAAMLLATCCIAASYGAGTLGDVTIAMIVKTMARSDIKTAAALISNVRASGLAAEAWSPMIEQLLVHESADLRTAAVTWLERNAEAPVPISEHLLFTLANSPDERTASAAARYLVGSGNRSAELVRVFIALLSRSTFDPRLRGEVLRGVGELGSAAQGAEAVLRQLALAEAPAEGLDLACEAVETMGQTGELSHESQQALTSLVAKDRCLREAVAALRQNGWSADKIAQSAQAAGAGAADNGPRAALEMELDESEGSERTERLPDLPEGDGLTEAELLTRIQSTDMLALRKLPKIELAEGMIKYVRISSTNALDEPIALLERLEGEQADQSSPVFAVLTDISIFKRVQEAVVRAAEIRLELAFPEIPLAAAMGEEPNYTRLLPKWPWSWPPPKYSSWEVLDLGRPANATIGTIFGRLSRSLELNGYRANRLYGVPGGVAVVTHLEQTTPDGKIIAGDQRWSFRPEHFSKLSFVSYLTDAFMGIRSHYRLFAFFMTKQPDISGGQSTLSLDQAHEPQVDGARVLPPEIAAVPWNGFYLHVVTYRFSKVNSKVVPVSSDVPSLEQLRRAGVLFTFKGRS